MFEFDLDNFKIRFPENENVSRITSFIDFVFEILVESLGIGFCSVILYHVGKSIGGKLCSTYRFQYNDLAQHKNLLENANDFLVNYLKKWKLVKDVAVFNALSSKNVPEVVCKIKYEVDKKPCVNENAETRITLMAFFFYRGIITGYYECFFNDSMKIRRIAVSSDDDNVFCEFIVELPNGGLDIESGEL